MPLVARGNGVDKVDTVHPICVAPGIIGTDQCSDNVFVANVGVHREGDLNEPHTHCPPVFGTPLVTFSSNVYANNKRVGRLGDTYSCGAKIIDVTQSTVFAN
jgi:uncharacterized Zn-binding protein involved in type VI secretion